MKDSFIFVLGILDPLYSLFGYILHALYDVITNYGWDIIIFTIFIRFALMPFYVKQHKTSLKQQQLTDELAELRRYYGKDRQGFSMAQMELFKKHKISMAGGCLTSMLSLILFWPVYRIITRPLHYIMGVSEASIEKIAKLLADAHLITAGQESGALSSDIPIIHALNTHGSSFTEVVSQGWMKADQLIDLNFFGINLGLVPSMSPSKIFGEQMSVYLPLFFVPLIAVLTSLAGSIIMMRTNPMQQVAKRSKELAKKNPARDVVTDPTAKSMKNMMYIMPIFTLFTSFTLPAAMGLYWIAGNLMMLVQSMVFFLLYTKPVMKQLEEQDALEHAKEKSSQTKTDHKEGNVELFEEKKNSPNKKKRRKGKS